MIKNKKVTHKKNRKTEPKSKILESIYESAKGMHEIGVMDALTMRKFESLCKNPVHELSPQEIKQIRLKAKVSQPVFAWYLNVKPTTVKKWETGENSPSGPALKLLNVVERRGLEYL